MSLESRALTLRNQTYNIAQPNWNNPLWSIVDKIISTPQAFQDEELKGRLYAVLRECHPTTIRVFLGALSSFLGCDISSFEGRIQLRPSISISRVMLTDHLARILEKGIPETEISDDMLREIAEFF